MGSEPCSFSLSSGGPQFSPSVFNQQPYLKIQTAWDSAPDSPNSAPAHPPTWVPLGPYNPTQPLLLTRRLLSPCSSRALQSLPGPQKGPPMRQMGSGGHRLGPATAQPADFGTISSSLEQSLTLPETTPPQEGKYGTNSSAGADHGWQGGRRAGWRRHAPVLSGQDAQAPGESTWQNLSPEDLGPRPNPGAGRRWGRGQQKVRTVRK